MVSYIRSDLDFILAQIKIAEAHALYDQSNGASGNPLFGGPTASIPTYNLSWGLRTVDGSFNHLLPGQEHWGASDREFPELVPAEFRTVMVTPPGAPGPVPVTYTPGADNDGPGPAGPGDVFDPTPRTISNLIVDQTLGNPAPIVTALTRNGVAGDLLAIAASIMAAYEPLKPLFKAVDDTLDAYSEAQAALDVANPLDAGYAALQAAAAAALAAFNAAEANLAGARGSLDALLVPNGIELSGANVVLPNVAPDVGLSAPFNSWFTLFGQFFDHGLDLVNKGGNGTVFIPLQPDDPLYNPDLDGPDNIAGNADDARNFMVLTRATTSAGADGVLGDNPTTIGVDESLDDGRPVNTTTSLVDQNQTYTSHPSHQVFLRAYVMTPNGPVATGKLIEGANGGMANWGEVKAQAALMLGIQLTDQDVGKVPLVRTDAYGNFIAGANGFPLLITGVGPDGIPNTFDDVTIPTDPGANGGLGTSLAGVLRTNMAFLADIAHNAVPSGLADGDLEIGLDNGGGSTDGFYDNELLDRHLMAGDGRVNENIGLTAVHHVFHSEHNRLVDHTKEVTVADAQAMLLGGASQAEAVAFLNEWLAVDVTAVPQTVVDINNLVWDGERLFQAAKFGTEMQYQHLVFEEFARKIQPSINVFIVPDGFETTVDPSIVAEFAHTVYRFGHSMLTETIDRFDSGFVPDHIGLIQGFLNPVEFDANGSLTDVIAAGDIIRGMTRQGGNHIDEFVTSALRNNLLGLPLDLPTINLARGRDTGVPSLNEARSQFYQATNQDIQLKPYESWTDFAGHLKHEASIINFVAAYGTHPLIEAESTIEGKRAAAFAIVFGTPQIVSGPETTGVAWTGPEGVAWIGLATPASSIDENILVDDAYYNIQNPDVLAAGIDPDLHFALFGAAEGRRPNQFSNFDGARYLAENPDVAAAGMDPLVHFLAFGRFEGRLFYSVAIDENIMVDDAYYNLTNPDVLANGMDPDLHFALFGAAEGRSPNQFFDAAYYLANNPGVTGNLLEHYTTTGWLSGRNPSPNFDGARYLAQNPDVAAAGMNPLLHFLAFGRFEGRLSYPVSVEVINPPADRLDFLNATGAYAGGTLGGLNTVDLWIGGLAEETMPFGGMLGSTFQFVFETQMESLQNGDRFYYLQRLDGLHLFGEMEANSFASLIMRNTNATHLPSDVFSTPGLILEVDPARQFNDLDGNGTLEGGDPVGAGILTELVIRNNPGTPGTDTNYLRYTGPEHVVLGGTDPGSPFNPSGNDILIGSEGDDTLHGDGGNDQLDGGFGNDIINGGAGDDIITDVGGDDNVKGGDGNDAIHGGPGTDLVLGGPGQDFVVLGTDDFGEVFGGVGNDFIHADSGAERILGNEGSDWLEGGAFSGAPGDNFDEIFARDGIDGNDVFLGEAGFDEFIGEGGDDIMVGSLGRGTMAGMSGFDWATYKDMPFGVNANLGLPIIFDENPTLPANSALERYEAVEGLSGSRFNDILLGTNDTVVEMGPIPAGGAGGFLGSFLDAEGIALINGLQDLLGAGVNLFNNGDIILGGDGSDVITGLAGDDVIDGDKWLDVQIGVFDAGDPDHIGTPSELHSSMASLTQQVFSGVINPGQLSIVRTIRDSNDQPDSDGIADVDVAVFSGVMADYGIAFNPDGTITVVDNAGTDGTDTLRNIEQLQFLDTSAGVVVGTAAAETLNGTAGINDTYVFTSAAAANGDTILTFEAGDRVDLTAIDANLGAVGDQSFTLTNGTLTGVAGELAFTFNAGITVVQGDIDGDAAADFSFGIVGNQTLTPGNTGL